MRIYGTAFILALLSANGAFAAQPYPVGQPTYAMLGDAMRAPLGWIEFCGDNPGECGKSTAQPHDIELTSYAWSELDKVNRWVNHHVRPMSDLDHWGVVEKWSIPTDGYGDCEDYVLLKRKMLIDLGWLPEALLITVVRDKMDEAHVVLTVKSDKGEFILDSQYENIVTSTESGYRFVERQSQSDPMVWLSLKDGAPSQTTVTGSSALPTVKLSSRSTAHIDRKFTP
jgi:predicted transglutaminase-like cysteine proteinase